MEETPINATGEGDGSDRTSKAMAMIAIMRLIEKKRKEASNRKASKAKAKQVTR